MQNISRHLHFVRQSINRMYGKESPPPHSQAIVLVKLTFLRTEKNQNLANSESDVPEKST